MFPDVDGDQFCLMCGERVYRWLGAFADRLLDAMERQALADSFAFRVPRFESRDAKPETRNPKPETRNSELES
jgi:hypothetical protein